MPESDPEDEILGAGAGSHTTARRDLAVADHQVLKGAVEIFAVDVRDLETYEAYDVVVEELTLGPSNTGLL